MSSTQPLPTPSYDDKASVLRNPDVMNVGAYEGVEGHGGDQGVAALFQHDFWGNEMWGSGWTHNSYRPLVVLSLRWNRLMAGVDNGTWWYHVTNVVIHAIVCMLAAALCLRQFGADRRVAATCAAVLFALHPLHTEVVANITGRAETMCSACMLAAILCYAKAVDAACGASHISGHNSSSKRSTKKSAGTLRVELRHGREDGQCARTLTWTAVLWILLAHVGVIVGGLCKETALATPALFLAYDLCHHTAALLAARRQAGMVTLARACLRTVACARGVLVIVAGATLAYIRVIVMSSG